MLDRIPHKFIVALLCLSSVDCQKAPEKLPTSSAEVGSRVSRYVEERMNDLGLSMDQANYCFEKLNRDMEAHPDVDLGRNDGDPGRLGMIEGYEKTFMDRCLTEVRSQ